MPKHVPVLFNEAIEFLDLAPGAFAIDGTLNGGGHAHEILKRISPGGTLLATDLDPLLLRETGDRLKEEFGDSVKMVFEHSNFARLPEIFEEKNLQPADVLLLDLGFSSAQLAGSGRGFAFSSGGEGNDEPLLMTYDPEEKPVKQWLRELTEQELADVIYRFSGERFSRRIALSIKEHLRREPIETAGQLADVIKHALPRGYERGRINPATRTFQALRILANHELESLETVLAGLPKIVKSGGRVCIISFHSLEDGIVKRAFRQMEKDGVLKIRTKKPIVATELEQKENPRSRSAKLRVAQIV